MKLKSLCGFGNCCEKLNPWITRKRLGLSGSCRSREGQGLGRKESDRERDRERYEGREGRKEGESTRLMTV